MKKNQFSHNKKKQVVILAAGCGVRFMPFSAVIPKCMAQINNVPILERNLDFLAKTKGVDEVIIVVGYKKEMIKKKIGNNFNGLKIIYTESDKYRTTNTIYSLWLAAKYIKKDFILMEADVVCSFEVIKALVDQPSKNLALAAKYEDYMEGPVMSLDEKTKQVKELIVKPKQMAGFDYSDKYMSVNIYQFTCNFFKKYFEPNMALHIKTGGVGDYYEVVLSGLLYLKPQDIFAQIVKNDQWYEIDTPQDLAMARCLFEDGQTKRGKKYKKNERR